MAVVDSNAGALIARVRHRHGITQAQLAIRAGISRAAISRIERGVQSPTVDRLATMLQVMGETLTLTVEPVQPWSHPTDLARERAMTAEERLEAGIRLAEFVTGLAAAAPERSSTLRPPPLI